MRASDFDYTLPPERIAQQPALRRDQSRLLVLERRTGAIHHRHFPELQDYLVPGDLLALNDSKVIPARLRALKTNSGGQIELLLLEECAANEWWALVRPGKRLRTGTRLTVLDRTHELAGITVRVEEKNQEGHCRLRFEGTADLFADLAALGETPLPPYLERARSGPDATDAERYQTVYAREAGSVAAPTAGLHFTAEFLDRLGRRGVQTAFVTLHVGWGTFAPLRTESNHLLHEERFVLGTAAAAQLNAARREGRRVIAVGTTTLRALESVAAREGGRFVAGAGRTRLFIHPPFRFQVVDALVTNFHLPKSTLLTLVCAFAAPGEIRGRDLVLGAYAEAIREKYRFYSYGDAMLII